VSFLYSNVKFSIVKDFEFVTATNLYVIIQNSAVLIDNNKECNYINPSASPSIRGIDLCFLKSLGSLNPLGEKGIKLEDRE